MVRSTLDPNNPPPLTPEQKTRLEALGKMPDDQIDYSDIPPLNPSELGHLSRALLLHIDLDIAKWLQSYDDYQNIVNAILRKEMLMAKGGAKPAEPAAKARKKPAAPKTQKPRRTRRVLEKVQ